MISCQHITKGKKNYGYLHTFNNSKVIKKKCEIHNTIQNCTLHPLLISSYLVPQSPTS